jgi:hypothetical protein
MTNNHTKLEKQGRRIEGAWCPPQPCLVLALVSRKGTHALHPNTGQGRLREGGAHANTHTKHQHQHRNRTLHENQSRNSSVPEKLVRWAPRSHPESRLKWTYHVHLNLKLEPPQQGQLSPELATANFTSDLREGPPGRTVASQELHRHSRGVARPQVREHCSTQGHEN